MVEGGGEAAAMAAAKEAEVAEQCSSGGGTYAALPTWIGVDTGEEADGGAMPSRRKSWRCRSWRELGLAAAHQPEAVTEVV